MEVNAKSLVEQFVYEIEHYGTILNANRTYFLTIATTHFDSNDFGSFPAQRFAMVAICTSSIESYYYYWTVPPHLNQTTGLAIST